MSLMDVPEIDHALSEAYRVLKGSGLLQFSILHPCLMTSQRRLVRDETGFTHAVDLGGYFDEVHGEIEEWLFSAAPPEAKAGLSKFVIPRFT